ncbi:MAG: aspartate-semialdehyde dehydrogenase, partial [Phormidesmis sp.]
MPDSYNVAILGATGAVGTELLQLLEERNFPIRTLKLLASSRSVGKTLTFKGREIAVEVVRAEAFQGVEIVLASAGGSTSKKWAQAIVDAGALMIDNSSAFRMEASVPLV